MHHAVPRQFVCSVVVAVLSAVSAPAAVVSGGELSVAEVLASPFPSSLTAAPDGERLAWVFTLRGVGNVWAADVPELEARRLTAFEVDDGRPLEVLGFSPDGTWVYFSKRSGFNPDHRPLGSGPSVLYRVASDGGEPEKLAEAAWAAVSPVGSKLAFVKDDTELWLVEPGGAPEKVVVARGTLSRPSWSPDGARLVMSTQRGEFPYRYSFITVYDTEARELSYLDPSVFLDVEPRWSPDGGRVAFLRRLTGGHRFGLLADEVPVPDPWEIRVTEVASGETVRAWRSPDDDSFDAADLRWLDDERIVFGSERDGWRHLYLVGADGRGLRQLTRGEYEVEAFTAAPELDRVLVTCNRDDADRRHIWSVDSTGDVQPITSGASIEWSPVPVGGGAMVAYVGADAVHPAHVFVRELGDGEVRKLAPGALPESFPSASLVEPRPVVARSVDGLAIRCQMFEPPDRFEGRRPAVMFLHGGPIRQMLLGFHYSSYYHRAYAMNQVLASRGFIVLSVNYRLGIGYGRTFRDVPDGGPRGGSEYLDLLAAARLLRNHPRVDPERIGLWGGSYGGLMTALGLARNSDLFAAGVDIHGVHDWNLWQSAMTGEPDDQGRPAWKSSPVADLRGWRSPVLLIHGDDDRNVPFSETKWLVEALRAMEVDVELLVFPDDVHSFLLHRNWVRAFEATADFFHRTLGN